MRILTLNAGSRSHKAQLYPVEDEAPLDPPRPEWERSVEAGSEDFHDLLARYDGEPPDAIGHRVVHPGRAYAGRVSASIDADVLRSIESAIPLARAHNPLALEGIAAATKRFGDDVAQVAVFDTALADDAPDFAKLCAVPLAWREEYGVRRYGFHGISQRDVIDRLETKLGKNPTRKTISLHIGNGASASAFIGRQLVETTMGMTPLEGLVMGERSGTIDPGVILALLEVWHLSPQEIERGLYEQSGLTALSGVSADTREIIDAINAGNARAEAALAYYAYRLRWHIGALAGILDGVDVIAFTGPVGEHSVEVRKRASSGLGYLGVALDDELNRASVPSSDIAAASSRVRIIIVPTLEEWAMARIAARETLKLRCSAR